MTEEILRTAVFISVYSIKGTGSVPEIIGLHTDMKNGYKAIIFGDLLANVESFNGNFIAAHRPSVADLESLVGVRFEDVDLVVIHLDAEYLHGAKEFQDAGIPGQKVVHAVCKKHAFDEAQMLIPDFHKGSFALPVDCGSGTRFGHLIKRWWISGHITKFKGSVAHTHPHFITAHV